MAISKYQGIFSITGAIVSTIALGNILPISLLSSYINSDNYPNTYPSFSLFYFSIALFLANVANLFSIAIVKITGTKILSLIGFILIGGGYSIFYFKLNIIFHYIAMGSIGSGIGLQFNPIIRNVWLYYPNSKGFISLIFILFYGLSAVLFSYFIEFQFSLFYIQGDLDTPESTKEEILSEFFLKTIGAIFTLAILGLLLLSNYLPEQTTETEDSNKKIFSKKEEFKQTSEILLSMEKSINEDILSVSNYNEMEFPKIEPGLSTFCSRLLSVLLSCRFWSIILMFFLSFNFAFLLTHSIRFLGINKGFNSHIILVSVIVYPSVITLSKIIISLLYNAVIKFKIMFSFILLLQIALGIVIPFVNNEYLFITFVGLGGFCYAGNSSLLSPLMTKIFGLEHSFEVNGLGIALSSLSAFVVPFVSLLFGTSMEIEHFIKYLFFGSVLTSVIALLLCFITSEHTFDYTNEQTVSLEKNLKASKSSKLKQWLESDVKSERNSG